MGFGLQFCSPLLASEVVSSKCLRVNKRGELNDVKSQELKPLKKFRKQVIKTFYIGIKGDGGVKSKGTRFLIEKE